MHDEPGRRAVFLDKDGTLIEDVPFNTDPARIRFTPHALDGLRLLADAGHALVVVTNQAGLAMGRITRTEYVHLRAELERRLLAEAGLVLDGWYTCPHAPGPGDVPACLCRKPAPGLLKQAALSMRLSLRRSWMVGDILDDVEAGNRAGCRTVMLDVGNETVWRHSPLRTPYRLCADLLDAARYILAQDAPAAAPRPALEAE